MMSPGRIPRLDFPEDLRMHIVVCIKQVPDTTEVRIDPERGTLIREGVQSILNPLDAYALEGALQLRERCGGRVTAMTMGPPQAAAVLREALACGCDDAVMLSDRAFAGADTWATSYTLAAAVRKLGDVDLVLCGKQAVDGDTAQVGPGMAVHLDWPQATYVRKLQEATEDHLVAERLTDHGNETLRLPLPAVVTVLKDLGIPRLPTLAGVMRARRAELTAWGADDLQVEQDQLGLDGSPTRVVRVFTPPPRGECLMLEGEPARAARELVGALKDKKVL
jgi:electron transfer flavoprotein beta subunit